MLRKYQNSLWVKSKKTEPSKYITDRRNILRIFKNSNKENEKIMLFILFLIFIVVVRFKMRSRKYAEPATQAPIISIEKLEIVIRFPEIIGL